MLEEKNKQKSPARRFLLILGVTLFICFFVFGLLVIFWDKMVPNLPQNQKILFGGLIIVYSVIRFARYLRKKPDGV